MHVSKSDKADFHVAESNRKRKGPISISAILPFMIVRQGETACILASDLKELLKQEVWTALSMQTSAAEALQHNRFGNSVVHWIQRCGCQLLLFGFGNWNVSA